MWHAVELAKSVCTLVLASKLLYVVEEFQQDGASSRAMASSSGASWVWQPCAEVEMRICCKNSGLAGLWVGKDKHNEWLLEN